MNSLAAEDPNAVAIPVCLPTGVDAKHLSRLGIKCYGFYRRTAFLDLTVRAQISPKLSLTLSPTPSWRISATTL